MNRAEKIAIIGLGYVGLPVAIAFGRAYDGVIGFDINVQRVNQLTEANDITGEIEKTDFSNSSITFTHTVDDIRACNVYIISVPTPIDDKHQPDLTPIISASETVASVLKKGDLVIYESTVYPGLTENICGKTLEKASGLKCGVDFTLGYSPERINPGDKIHRLETIVKVVSGQDNATLNRVADLYNNIIDAGIHRAPSIKVAEAAKVIENTQRDLNVALMNELSLIFERLNIRTKDVLEAAGTKWNFLPFTPGLVGGHCIGVDPYYLTSRAEEFGYYPQVILSGRRINDGMGAFIAQKTIKLLVQAGHAVRKAKVGILGLTFKENVSDLRNSRVPDIIEELNSFGISPLVHDPMACAAEARELYNVDLVEWETLKDLDALIIAVPHDEYLEVGVKRLAELLGENSPVIDIKSMFNLEDFNFYWSL